MWQPKVTHIPYPRTSVGRRSGAPCPGPLLRVSRLYRGVARAGISSGGWTGERCAPPLTLFFAAFSSFQLGLKASRYFCFFHLLARGYPLVLFGISTSLPHGVPQGRRLQQGGHWNLLRCKHIIIQNHINLLPFTIGQTHVTGPAGGITQGCEHQAQNIMETT